MAPYEMGTHRAVQGEGGGAVRHIGLTTPLVKNPAYGPEHTRTRYQRYFRHDVIYTSYTVDVDACRRISIGHFTKTSSTFVKII